MNPRLIAGAAASYFYGTLVGRLPSGRLRRLYLRGYLGSLGADAFVGLNCRFLHGRRVFLGERSVLNFGCLLDGRRHNIHVGADASIGPEAAILTLGHDPQSPDFADRGGEVIIGPRAWIAFRAIVLPGVTIGEGAVVAAGAVVTRDVAPFSIVAGSPAREVGTRERGLHYQLNYKPFLQ